MDKNSNNNIKKVSDGTLFPLFSVDGKKVEVSFTALDLSSCGGLLLLKECE